MNNVKTTKVRAMADASGHTEADAAVILSELRKAGWTLVRMTSAPAPDASPSRETYGAEKGQT